ncbi:MAG: sulfatase-like hydrolase/transferase [Prevotella sp.]|jgi:phosphoglycerol transferase MdoB-like AlkP superfamily enzyme|nr:sulfatase-like hydrolase/transferase [Prevotella sp.]
MMKISAIFRYFISVHLLALFFLLLIRVLLLFSNWENTEGEFGLILNALVKGVWFDNVIACYVSVLPLVALSVPALLNIKNKVVIKITSVYYIVFFGLIFALSVSDIPYFKYFFKHIDASIFNWKEESSEALSMIFQESLYYAYFVVFIVVMLVFAYLVIKMSKSLWQNEHSNLTRKKYILWIPLTLMMYGLCLLGIRGTAGRNPIKTSHAYFCNNSFLNQLGLNPAFYLIKDVLNKQHKQKSIDDLVSGQQAIETVRNYLGIDTVKYNSPIARDVVATGARNKKNVVVVLMESMSMNFLDIKYKDQFITPYLNELKQKSYFFENFYSMGTHTNQGVWCTFSGLPSFFDENIMKGVQVPVCQGLAPTLKKEGYQTIFFLPHEPQYDNMMSFLKENDVDHVYSQEDYPSTELVNIYGVSDRYLFNYAHSQLTEAAKQDRPFFATILTVSNHPPFVIPPQFKDRGDKAEEQIVAYADDCIREFMMRCAAEEWFDNTIFVFLGDHGEIVGKQTYEMPLSYHHIPLIIYSQSFGNTHRIFSGLGCQMDVFPTIMGLLNASYVNNTLGVDLMKDNRRFVSFASDNMMGCVDKDMFYIYSLNTKRQMLFDYRNKSTVNIIDEHRELADSMRIYSASQLLYFKRQYRNNKIRIAGK